jgi:GNAT superfamily N-acetyltransferase
MYSNPEKITLSRRTGEREEFLIRRCTEEDLSDILDLQLKIYEGIGDPDIYALVDGEEIRESLLMDNCFAVFHGDSLVAYTMMIRNRVSYRNYGTYIGYPEERQKVCVSFEISMVDKAYRGYGLQRYFIEMREELARHMGAEEVLVTISPKNERSLANMQYEGFEIVCTKPLYQGAMRHILRKNL